MPVPSSDGVAARSRLRDDAFRLLRDAIIDGTLRPGERLNDAELVGWLGVSRTPIREALARLEYAGLVRTRPGRYTMVSPLDAREIAGAQRIAAALHELAVRDAVPAMSSVEFDAMREANGRFAAALAAQDADAALAADDDFHDVAVEASANPMLRPALEQVIPVLRRAERLRFSSLAGRGSVALHERIINLCVEGDAEAAGRAAREPWLLLDPWTEHEQELPVQPPAGGHPGSLRASGAGPAPGDAGRLSDP